MDHQGVPQVEHLKLIQTTGALLLEAQDLQLLLLQLGQEEQGVLQEELLRVNRTTDFLLLEALMLHHPKLRVLIKDQPQVVQVKDLQEQGVS